MAANVNVVILAGNLTRDVELRTVGNQNNLATFGLAVTRKFRNRNGELTEETTFVDCEAWGRTAELVAQYLQRGSSCMVEGRLKFHQWTDESTGQQRSRLKVHCEQVQFLGSRSSADGQHDSPNQHSQRAQSRGQHNRSRVSESTPGPHGSQLIDSSHFYDPAPGNEPM